MERGIIIRGWGGLRRRDPSLLVLQKEALLNPQLLNPYSYGLNNPLRYNDPDGKNPAETIGVWGVGFTEALGGTAIWIGGKVIHPVRSSKEAGQMVSRAGDEVFSILMDPGVAVKEAGQGYGIQAKEFGEWYWNASDYERGKILGTITEKVAEGYAVGKVAGRLEGTTTKALAKIDVKISSRWANTTFNNLDDAIGYHYNKHGIDMGLNLEEYTQQATSFYNLLESPALFTVPVDRNN